MYDVDDVLAGASHLVEKGLVDGARLSIDASSVASYTMLSALTVPGSIFKAGKATLEAAHPSHPFPHLILSDTHLSTHIHMGKD